MNILKLTKRKLLYVLLMIICIPLMFSAIIGIWSQSIFVGYLWGIIPLYLVPGIILQFFGKRLSDTLGGIDSGPGTTFEVILTWIFIIFTNLFICYLIACLMDRAIKSKKASKKHI